MKKNIGFAVAMVAMGTCAARAEYLPFPPVRETICASEGRVDRDKLASYLIRKYPVSLLALSRIQGPVGVRPAEILARLLADKDICKEGCAESDAKNIRYIQGNMLQLLSGSAAPVYSVQRPIEASDYFSPGNRIEIACAGGTQEAPGALFSPPPKLDGLIPQVRVRGKAEHLYVDRSQKLEFGATEKATLSYTRDEVAGTNTFKGIAYAGYWMELLKDTTGGTRSDLIPYVGIDRNVTRVEPDSQAKPSAKSAASLGVLSASYWVTSWAGSSLGHLVTLRPDFTADHRTGTRLLSAAIEYFPVRNGKINDFWKLGPEDSFVWAKWIFSLKANAGHFTDRGSGPDADLRAGYGRWGGKAGIAIVSDNPALPLDFIATYTSMAAFRGDVNIDYRAATLTFSLDPDKYFGITLGYKRGKREDTAIRDEEVTLGLSGRF